MANIKVSEMTEATLFDDGDYSMIVQANQNKKILKENMFSSINDEISKVRANMGTETDTYDQDKTYNINDFVIKNNNIHECNENDVTGTWDPSKWSFVSILSQETSTINEKFLKDYQRKPVQLNTNNITSSGGQLTQNISDFKRIEIYATSDENMMISTTVFNNNASSLMTCLMTHNIAGTSTKTDFMRIGRVIISGTSVTLDRLFKLNISGTNTNTFTTANNAFTITKILGYTY